MDRFAFSVMWELDSDYNVKDTWFGEELYLIAVILLILFKITGKTVIRSAHELHYGYAQDIVDSTISDMELIRGNSR